MDRYDVLAVDLATKRVSLMAPDLTEPNAEAVVQMAVMRRGVEEAFYVAEPAGLYAEGDTWPKETVP